MKFEELEAIYRKPLFELVSLAHDVHKKEHYLGEIKLARLISIKTGGCTFGMLTRSQAEQLKSCGLYAYNHNLDSSEDFYKTIVTTRSYADRLQKLDVVDGAGIHTCCGGILRLGESEKDRLMLIHTLLLRKLAPESIPVKSMLNFMQKTVQNLLEDLTVNFSFLCSKRDKASAEAMMAK